MKQMSTWRIIGSTAAYHWFPHGAGGKPARVPKDIDLLTPAKVASDSPTTCLVDAQWHSAAEYLISINRDPVFLDPDLLLTLKVSHAHWDVKWSKTIWDVWFLQEAGAKLNMDAYDRLFKVWTEVHGAKKVNLKKPVAEFFIDAVRRKHDHEQLHELLAFNDRPMHERLRPDNLSVWCDAGLFNALSAEQQFQTALEELLVVAVERFDLDSTSTPIDILKAVNGAYHQLVTSMTTGWFARFLILNHCHLTSRMKSTWLPHLQSVLKHL